MVQRRKRFLLAIAAAAGLVAAPAMAQLLPRGALPNLIPSLPRTLHNTTGFLDNSLRGTVAVVRDVAGRPANPRAFENDNNGARVLRGEVLCLSPTEQSLAAARSRDFEVVRQETLAALGLQIAVLRAPSGMSATEALALLQRSDPSGHYDYNHIYNPSGEGRSATAKDTAPAGSVPAPRIGMIDGGIDRNHSALRHAAIETMVVAGDSRAPATAHGTAVASLLVGQASDFHGALVNTTLYAADVYGGVATGGSAVDIARALGWLASKDVPVSNISLAGPPNLILAAAVAAFVRSGHILVAAVGNDGPAAPERYPAAYAGVVGVTSVDAQRAIQMDANRGADVAFAARGVDVRAAKLAGGYTVLTGTSYAAPLVAARFAVLMPRPDPAAAAQAWATLKAAAIDLGPPGRDTIFGYGYLDPPTPMPVLATSDASH
ncbi:MAG: S8 family serine peptidase [Rhizomicrobium sp.]|nr:S8 family serine peptidase [Rhizomicrobium sp.]